ncbi:serine hydrolase domain-containing protein [Oceanirhabdus sp. W0125-5]|uniref:serine hydrolase domain-containing protein n=1 Tax=Oceanirhabdus sp. W0125-5 TaxID=2999116 RepID=UPI0022F31E6C|nr:serine hydrolase [Oceanirhabdus sp. W0125-5]WBW96756.1 serine hydrolase [Oceanirhabdus sp. W0125-5]
MENNIWENSSPEDQDMDSHMIREAIKFIEEKNKNIHSILIVKDGSILTDKSFNPDKKDKPHDIYSCSKSIVSTLIGIAIDEGLIDSINNKVLDFFPEVIIHKEDINKKEITIENLLTMTTGLKWNDYKDYDELWESENPIEYFFGHPLISEPGTKFCYCSGVPHILQFILEKVTGEDIFTYAKKKLFEPLGIKEVYWPEDDNGMKAGIMLSPINMAKFGYLFLKEGKWGENQIVSSEWVKKSTMKHIETPLESNMVTNFGSGYGYQWWMNHFGGFHANGFGGQYIFVVPKLDLVVVFTGSIYGDDFYIPQILMERYIVKAMK